MKFCSLVLLFATAQACLAQNDKPPSWQTVRDHQPAGVHLLLALPKTHYHLGEVIIATLTFSHEAKDAYFLSGPSGGRSGRVNDFAFRGEGDDHRPIPDPLEWYLKNHFLMGGGGGTQKHLGPLAFSLAANQWLQFEKPGTYQIYAWSSCLIPGARGSVYDQRPPPVELVSDPITITIEPLPADAEKMIIEEATQVLNKQREVGRFDLAFDALERLRFLQTPAASDTLLQFVDVAGSQASLAFYGRPNYAASAAHILTLVQEGRLGLSENLLYLYLGLKSGGFRDFAFGGDSMQTDRLARDPTRSGPVDPPDDGQVLVILKGRDGTPRLRSEDAVDLAGMIPSTGQLPLHRGRQAPGLRDRPLGRHTGIVVRRRVIIVRDPP